MALPTTGLTTNIIKNTIGASTNNTGQLCIHSNVNKWSKFKPVSYASVSPLTDAQFKETNYGLNITGSNNLDSPTGWSYVKPTGGQYSPYRLGDFRGYNHQAKPFMWVDDYDWNYIATPSAQDIDIVPAFKFGAASYEGQGGAGGADIDLLPIDFNLTNLGGEFTNFYLGVYHRDSSNNTYYAFSNKTIGESSISTPLWIEFGIGEGGLASTTFINYINSLSVNDSITLTPFFCFTQSYNATKYCFPNGQTMTLTKKNVYADSVIAMWNKLNVFVTGGVTFTNYTKSINLGGGAIYQNIISTTPVHTVTHNEYPTDVLKITISGQITVNESVTVYWNGMRAYVDGIGKGNYLTPVINVGGANQVAGQGGYFDFVAGTTYGFNIVDYVQNPGNLLSNLPISATYMTAAKPEVGLMSYDILSNINGLTGVKGKLCLGRA